MFNQENIFNAQFFYAKHGVSVNDGLCVALWFFKVAAEMQPADDSDAYRQSRPLDVSKSI